MTSTPELAARIISIYDAENITLELDDTYNTTPDILISNIIIDCYNADDSDLHEQIDACDDADNCAALRAELLKLLTPRL